MQKLVEKLESVETNKGIKLLEDQIHGLEWRGRKQNLEIHGIPTEQNEDLPNKFNDLANMLHVSELSDMDVIELHRLPPKLDKTPGIVVRLTRRMGRDKWLDYRRNLKRSDTPIHILEDLTIQNKMLLW